MEKLEKYIKMCRLAIKRRLTQTDKQEEEKLNAWLRESEENRELYHSTDYIDLAELNDYYSKTDVEYQLSRFHKGRKRTTRSIVWRWSAAAAILLVGGLSLYMMNKTEPVMISSMKPLPAGVSLVLTDVKLTSRHPITPTPSRWEQPSPIYSKIHSFIPHPTRHVKSSSIH